MVKLHNIKDIIDLLYNKRRPLNDSFSIVDHEVQKEIPHEKLHSKFCKYATGIPKYTSTTGVYKEIDRYPITIKAWARAEIHKTRNYQLENVYHNTRNKYDDLNFSYIKINAIFTKSTLNIFNILFLKYW